MATRLAHETHKQDTGSSIWQDAGSLVGVAVYLRNTIFSAQHCFFGQGGNSQAHQEGDFHRVLCEFELIVQNKHFS